MEKVLSAALYVLLLVIFVFSAGLVVPVYRRYCRAQQEVAELDRALAERRLEGILVLLRESTPVWHDDQIGASLAATGDHRSNLRYQLVDVVVPPSVGAHEIDFAVRLRHQLGRREGY